MVEGMKWSGRIVVTAAGCEWLKTKLQIDRMQSRIFDFGSLW
jgi:hypothetical protein